MRLSILLASVATLGILGQAMAEGGATTVGDGGHVIMCKGKPELFDLFEYRVNTSQNRPVTLGESKSANLNDMINTGVARIAKRFALTQAETARVKRATKMLLLDGSTTDNKGWLQHWAISAHSLKVSEQVAAQINLNRCSVDLAVIRPPLNEYFQSICSHNFSEFEYCFIVFPEPFQFLKREQRACLALHESLRFLPPGKQLDEKNLRMVTAQICTE